MSVEKSWLRINTTLDIKQTVGESVVRSWWGDASTWGEEGPLGANATGVPAGSLPGYSTGGPGVPWALGG